MIKQVIDSYNDLHIFKANLISSYESQVEGFKVITDDLTTMKNNDLHIFKPYLISTIESQLETLKSKALNYFYINDHTTV